MDHRGHNAQHSPELFLLFALAFVALFLFGIGYGLWIYARPVFTLPSLFIADIFSSLMLFILDDAALSGLNRFVQQADARQMTWQQFVLLWTVLGGYFKWPLGVFILWLGFNGYRLHKSGVYQTTYSLESFITFQAQIWSSLKAVSSKAQDILKARPGETWGSALSPDEWADRHKLIVGGLFDAKKATKAFDRQLARPWLGPDALPLSLRLLCSVFLLLIAKEKDQAKSLLHVLSQMAEKSGDVDKALAENSQRREWEAYATAVFNHPKWGKPVLRAISLEHAFVETAFLSLLTQARKASGVLPTAEFLWLKPSHRGLYYALNALGRRSFQVEAAGVMAHYESECQKGRLLLIPDTLRAVHALAAYLERL